MTVPIARSGLVLAIVGPALAIGGVSPLVAFGFAVVVGLVWLRMGWRRGGHLRWPWGAGVGLGLVFWTALQWAPLGSGWVSAVAPALADVTSVALPGARWPRLSVVPGNTGVACLRLAALVTLFVACAQLSWRFVALAVLSGAVLVVSVGLVHEWTQATAIYGLYWPAERDLAASYELITPFVNPNHQSAALLLGWFAAWALLVDQSDSGGPSTEAARERRLALVAAASLVLFGLLLSLSRGALVVLAVMSGVTAVACRRQPSRRRPDERGLVGTSRWSRGLAIGGLSLLVVAVGRHGAWEQLGTLAEPGAFARKFAVAERSLALIRWSPWFGIGRGCFVDVYPWLGSTDSRELHTHLENLPAAWLVELGVPVATLALLGAVVWLILAWRGTSARAQRVAMLGLVAVVLQNLGDFNLAYLGVGAPVVALAGALSPTARRHAWHRWGRTVVAGQLMLATIVGLTSYRGTWSSTQQWKRDHWRDPDPSAIATALQWRPLDGDLHLVKARQAAQRGAWDAAESAARVVMRTRTDAVEARLLLASALESRGDRVAAEATLASAIAHLRAPVSPELARYLVSQQPDPNHFASALPEPLVQYAPSLGRALLTVAPAHAAALAKRWDATAPNDPGALALRCRAALARREPALALHFARLYRARRPTSAAGYLLQVSALRQFEPRRGDEALSLLLHARQVALDDPGSIEEALLSALARRGRVDDVVLVQEIASSLRNRAASPAVRRRRVQLIQQAQTALVAD
ncbi:MAG: O-antigen ligase family protein [Myxococcales bacterium FL481]|nr:MAG: O-antigen ligase family protein [Myxococcales bacterium FL481]